jgi:hypothetical protein
MLVAVAGYLTWVRFARLEPYCAGDPVTTRPQS